MGLRIQFFGKGGQNHPPIPEPPAAAVVSAPAVSATNGGQTVGAAPTPSPVPVAIRSLTRYQHDPAFQNFQWKLRHPPRTGATRGRRRADDAQRQVPRTP
jgi:hypothetical protein